MGSNEEPNEAPRQSEGNTTFSFDKVLIYSSRSLKVVGDGILRARLLPLSWLVGNQESAYLNIFITYIQYSNVPLYSKFSLVERETKMTHLCC